MSATILPRMPQIIYLHGFASSPDSKKAKIFSSRFGREGVAVKVPNLVTDGFRNLTVTGQLKAIEAASDGQKVSLIGSSMGGYLAALYAARHAEVERLVLLAPAFGFARLWADTLGPEKVRRWQRHGAIDVMNYAAGGQLEELGWQLMDDARNYEEDPAILQPCLIYHGVQDTVVPVQASRSFARTRTCCELREMESDHELMNVIEEVWQGTREFLLG